MSTRRRFGALGLGMGLGGGGGVGEVLGPELVVNGDFATDTDWIKGADWSIGGGVASCAAYTINSSLIPSINPTTVGVMYRVTFDIISTANTPYVRGFGTQFKSIVGQNSYTLEAVSDFSFFNSSTLSFIGDIDNVSIKEVL